MNSIDADVASTTAFVELEPNEILSSLEAIGVRCDGRFLTLNSYENRVYQVGTEDEGTVVAKFYRPGRWSDEAILEEHRFSHELADLDIPVVPPMERRGRTLHHSGPFRISVSPSRGGRAPELDNASLMRQLGRLVARMHLAGETTDFSFRPSLDIDDLDGYGPENRSSVRPGFTPLSVVSMATANSIPLRLKNSSAPSADQRGRDPAATFTRLEPSIVCK